MLKSMLASNATKLVASCVCPVAATVGVTLTVPKVRNAVHRATAPRAYALPKTRIRPPVEPVAAPVETAAIPPCASTLVAGPIGGGVFQPDAVALQNLGSSPFLRDVAPAPVGGGGTGGLIGGTLLTPDTPIVPEPRAWVQMIIGFGLIGGAARYSLRAGKTDPDAQPEA